MSKGGHRRRVAGGDLAALSCPLRRNLLTRVPKASQGMVATLVRTIFEQPDHDSVWDQHARVVDQLTGRFDDAALMLADAAEDLLAFSTFPAEHWTAIRSNNPLSVNRPMRWAPGVAA